MSVSLAAPQEPRLGPIEERFQQERFFEQPELEEVRHAGLRMFATPFNHADGYGDGPMNPEDPVTPGGRPTIANNGTFLRINGLDGQACVECHAMISSRTMPPRFGVGGFGGISNAPFFQPKLLDVSDVSELGFAFTDGRVIVPPHLFGAGGVQLLAEEMTADLAALRDEALAQPGVPVELVTKGVSFGFLEAGEDGQLDFGGVTGIDDDLIVKPFGRKGEFPTVRAFDEGAMEFHFGMQPVELVGADVDADGDGVANEVLVGEMSALEVFITTMDRPRQTSLAPETVAGFVLFRQVGCADCHRPFLSTRERTLHYRTAPGEPAHYSVDLSAGVADFPLNATGGLSVPLFSDLKRHTMGPALAESFHGVEADRNAEFITAKLWGVADTAPYLHDGRALSLDEAIRWHGGEAQAARDGYVGLSDDAQAALLGFLQTLRLPEKPNADVVSN